jgi:hypothetical protein
MRRKRRNGKRERPRNGRPRRNRRRRPKMSKQGGRERLPRKWKRTPSLTFLL